MQFSYLDTDFQKIVLLLNIFKLALILCAVWVVANLLLSIYFYLKKDKNNSKKRFADGIWSLAIGVIVFAISSFVIRILGLNLFLIEPPLPL